eukprot:jgi/Psemu1/325740/estExt_fgenesh1_pg.C_2790001
MRQIITQNTWSSNPNLTTGSRFGSTTSLNTVESSSGRGETDSSFEVPNSTSSSNSHSNSNSNSNSNSTSNYPLYRKPLNIKNESNGSMQFAPADHEISWDALASDSGNPNHSFDRFAKSTVRSVVTPSPPSSVNRMPGRSSSFLRKARQQHQQQKQQKQQKQQRSEGVPFTSAVKISSGDSISRSNSNSKSKITRLASMFSSRAEPVVVPLRATSPVERNAKVSPPSPPRSEASSGYIGWPGTQDKEGVTVVAESSYEESDASIGNHGGSLQNSAHSHSLSAPSCPGDMPDKIHRLAIEPSTGYRGLLDKTQEVPNLMDETASDTTSTVSAATSRQSSPSPIYRHPQERPQRPRHHQRVTTIDEGDNTEDDLIGNGNNYVANSVQVGGELDGYDATGAGANMSSIGSFTDDNDEGFLGARSRSSMEKLNLALLGGGLTTIQTTADDFSNRKTAKDFDETLSDSDCDQEGFVRLPAFDEMVSAGRNHHDRALSCQSLQFASAARAITRNQNDRSGAASNYYPSMMPQRTDADGDFTQYYIESERMQVLVKKFRRMSLARCKHIDHEDLEREEDATKAFALSEMRSRIMETDIERGLERRGGTTVVDDIVMTSFYKTALRVRDAVIVAKAWRDGATPHDVVTTANLTRREERSYYIPRWNAHASTRGASKYTWEEVNWLDDSELSQYRCHSIGPRHLKGVEMFTIGDCQSILLKLSYERCNELRAELDEATSIQIEAEALMKAEGETFDGMMTEAEMTYLTSMEEVKSISQKLVLAEKSFKLVKNRIEKLVAKYEALLVHFENETESVAPSSVFSYESSCYSDFSFAAAKRREDETMARRAERAELRAELAARESRMTNQDTKSVYQEKEQVVNNLKVRIADLQSETSAAVTDRDRSVVLARALRRGPPSNGNGNAGGRNDNRSKINDIKQRFRDRSAAAKSQGNTNTGTGNALRGARAKHRRATERGPPGTRTM